MEDSVRDVDTGSEAGGEDALVGNVNKLLVAPLGYTGAQRKGHLVFDACFESGNLGRVDYISEFEFDLFIRPDTTASPRFRVWFNFSVENVRETQQQRRLDLLTITNPGESCTLVFDNINNTNINITTANNTNSNLHTNTATMNSINRLHTNCQGFY
ncbi:LOW QUALITY PROTEIN: cytosolic carboxypeptidase 6 [Osmerus mordax]|uniref:LOW QUALITY PROTEIN: cytosolic carboxypeptidase 6 n=1 Tax=Osmerus mordax TaxID=8014 RepID=UPI00350F4D59